MRAISFQSAALLALLALYLGNAGVAQQAPAPPASSGQKVVSTTELVLVPVVVHDKSGAHVTGLAKNDFEVFEAGKRQNIAVFEEVKASTSPTPRTPPTEGVYTNKLGQDGSRKRVVVIVLDELNSSYVDEMRARQQLIQQLVSAIGDGSMTALLRMDANGITVVHDFASDPRELVEGLRHVLLIQNGEVSKVDLNRPKADLPPEATIQGPDAVAEALKESGHLGEYFESKLLARASKLAKQAAAIEVTLDCFQQIARGLAGIPGRKSLVWVTGSFPVSLNPMVQAQNPFYPVLDARSERYLDRTMQILEDANVAVYPVDIRGLVTLDMGGIEEYVTGMELRQGFSGYTPYGGPTKFRLEAMRSFAAATGGVAFYNNNQISEGVRDAIVDSSNYYLLGYYRSQKASPMQWLPIKVKVHKSGVRIRSRSALYLGNPGDTSYAAELMNAMDSPWDYTGVPVSVRWSGAPLPDAEGKKQAGFEIRIDPTSVRVADHQVQLQYAAAVKTADGKLITRWGRSANGPVTPKQEQQIASEGVAYSGTLSLPPGSYFVRFVVRDDATGRMGSVLAPLTVN